VLKEYIELDEGFFETTDRRAAKKENKNQQGRGISKQAAVLVAVESIPVEDKEDGTNRKVKHLKMAVMDSLNG
jgi:hypothetical protein